MFPMGPYAPQRLSIIRWQIRRSSQNQNTAAINIHCQCQNKKGAKRKVAGKANSNHVNATRQADSGQISGDKVFETDSHNKGP